MVGEAIREQDWVRTANTCRGWARRPWSFDRPDRHPGNSIGTATDSGLSLRVALAHRGSGKLVIDIQSDGDLMFTPGALWTAAHEKLALLTVVVDNRSCYNSEEHQFTVARHRQRDAGRAPIATRIEDPVIDYCALARSMGPGPRRRPARRRSSWRRYCPRPSRWSWARRSRRCSPW